MRWACCSQLNCDRALVVCKLIYPVLQRGLARLWASMGSLLSWPVQSFGLTTAFSKEDIRQASGNCSDEWHILLLFFEMSSSKTEQLQSPFPGNLIVNNLISHTLLFRSWQWGNSFVRASSIKDELYVGDNSEIEQALLVQLCEHHCPDTDLSGVSLAVGP